MTPDEVRECLDRHKWKPGERDALTADIAQRTARHERGEDEATWSGPPNVPVIHKSHPGKAGMTATDAWDRRIAEKIQAHEQVLLAALGEVLAEQEANLQEANKTLAADLEAVQRRLALLEARLDAKRPRRSYVR